MNRPGSGPPESAPREPLRTTPTFGASEYPRPVILLADPDPDSRVIFSTMLRHRGFRPVAVERGEQVLQAGHSLEPRVAVLDVMLGWDVLEAFRADRVCGRIPLAVLSAVDLGPERARARELGCAVFLSKPISPSELVAAVRDLLSPTR